MFFTVSEEPLRYSEKHFLGKFTNWHGLQDFLESLVTIRFF